MNERADRLWEQENKDDRIANNEIADGENKAMCRQGELPRAKPSPRTVATNSA